MSARASITLNEELYALKERLSFDTINYGPVTQDPLGDGYYTTINVPVFLDAINVGVVEISAHVYFRSDPLDPAPGRALAKINGYEVRTSKTKFIGTLSDEESNDVVIHMAQNYVKDRDIVTHVDWAAAERFLFLKNSN
jgi:hypothetical protein